MPNQLFSENKRKTPQHKAPKVLNHGPLYNPTSQPSDDIFVPEIIHKNIIIIIVIMLLAMVNRYRVMLCLGLSSGIFKMWATYALTHTHIPSHVEVRRKGSVIKHYGTGMANAAAAEVAARSINADNNCDNCG